MSEKRDTTLAQWKKPQRMDFLLLRSVERPPRSQMESAHLCDDHIGKWMISANNKHYVRLTDLNNLCAQHAHTRHSRSSSVYFIFTLRRSSCFLFFLFTLCALLAISLWLIRFNTSLLAVRSLMCGSMQTHTSCIFWLQLLLLLYSAHIISGNWAKSITVALNKT